MHEDPAGQIRPVEIPSGGSSIDPRVLGPTVDVIDKAHHVLAQEPRLTGQRSPAAELFVALIDGHAQAQGRRSQEFFTPRSVVRLAVDLLTPSSSTRRIYDPFCRAGEFLVEAVSRLNATGDGLQEAQVQGRHPSQDLCSIARMNLRLHGVEPVIGNGFWWDSPSQPERQDLVFANPPFNLRLPEAAVYGRPWHYGQPPHHKGNFAWVQHILSTLGPDGRAAVVMPNNATFSASPRERAIRAAMIEDGAVDCVIALPAGLFPGTGIPVSLWLLRKPSGGSAGALLVDATHLGASAGRGARILADADSSRIVAAYRKWLRGEDPSEAGLVRLVPIAEVRAHDHALHPSAYVAPSETPGGTSSGQAELPHLLRRSSLLKRRVRDLSEEIERLTALLGHKGESRGNWVTTTLAELCALKAGPSGSHLRADVQQQHDGVRILLPKNIRSGYVADDDIACVPQEVARKLAGYRLEIDDLVCTRTGELGRVAMIDREQQAWLFSTGLVRLRTREGILPSYLAHVLASRASREWITRHATGTVVASIPVTTLAKLPVTVPPLEEQRWITAALNAVAEQVRLHTQLASAADSMRNVITSALFTAPNPR